MAVKPSQVAKSDKEIVTEVEKEIDAWLLERAGKIEQRVDVPVPERLTALQREELASRYRAAGWRVARFCLNEPDGPVGTRWLAMVLEVQDGALHGQP